MAAAQTIIRALIGSLTLGFFVLQVWSVIDNYIKGRTTVTTRREKAKAFLPPAIMFHPKQPFNIARASRIGVVNPFKGSNRYNFTSSRSLDVYNNSTYSLDADFNIFYLVPHSQKVRLKLGNNSIQDPSGQWLHLRMLETYSAYLGKCYTIQVDEEFRIKSIISIMIQFTGTLSEDERPKTMSIYLIREVERYRVMMGAWQGSQPFIFDVETNYTGFAIFQKSIVQSLPGKDTRNHCTDIEDPGYSSTLCKLIHVGKQFSDKMANDCNGVICYVAKHRDLFTVMNLTTTYCQDPNDFKCQANVMMEIMQEDFGHICPEQCTNIHYTARILSQYNYEESMRNGLVFNLLLDSEYVVIKEEVLLFDFPTFVGSVGGSLGLFLGFSFFDCASFITDKLSFLFLNQGKIL